MRRRGVKSDRNISRVRIKRSSDGGIGVDASLAAVTLPAESVALVITKVVEARALDIRRHSTGTAIEA